MSYNKTTWINNSSPAISAENLNKIEDTLEALWPAIGDIEINISGINPTNKYPGTTWIEVGQGQCLMGAGSWNNTTYAAGDSIDAGLPNITGSWNNYGEGSATPTMASSLSGAIYGVNSTSPGWGTSTGLDNDNYALGFDASRCSSIYGSSTTVQPPALVVHFYQRTA